MGIIECYCVGVAIDAVLSYVFDKSVIWNSSYYRVFFLRFQINKQSEDQCAFAVHHGVTNLLFFHSGAPLPSGDFPTLGRPQDDEEGIWA